MENPNNPPLKTTRIEISENNIRDNIEPVLITTSTEDYVLVREKIAAKKKEQKRSSIQEELTGGGRGSSHACKYIRTKI